MIKLRRTAAFLLVIGALYFAPLLLVSQTSKVSLLSVDSSGQWEQQQAETLLEHRLRRLHQNDFSSSTIPPKFSQLDRAAETQRIYRSVAEERAATAKAVANPTAAWQDWLVQYNITYSGKSEADYRRQVWLSNLERADRLNQMVGPEVAFGLNRFSGLTPEEFLQQYTGDAQKDSGINVTPENPQMLDTPVAPLLANLSAGTFLTPKGQQQNTTAPGAGNGNGTTTNATAPSDDGTTGPPVTPVTGPNGAGGIPPGGHVPPNVRPDDGSTGGGTTGGGGAGGGGTIPTDGTTLPIVRPGGTPTPGIPAVPGTPGTPPVPGGLVTPPIITPTPPAGGVTPTPGGTTTPATPPPPGTIPTNPPGVVAPGGGATTPSPPGVTAPGTSPAPGTTTPPGGTVPPIVRPPGSIPTVGLPPPTSTGAPSSPGATPSPAPGAAPAPSPAPGTTPAPSPSPAAGAPASSPSPSPVPGAPGVPPGGTGPIVRPPIGPPPPAGKRRRQLLDMQLQQWVDEQQQQLSMLEQQGGTSLQQENITAAAGEAAGRSLLNTEEGLNMMQELDTVGQQRQRHRHQPGHGYFLVLKAMAAAVKQAYHAWGVLLSGLISRGAAASTELAVGDSDAAVGSTPYWLQDSAAADSDDDSGSTEADSAGNRGPWEADDDSFRNSSSSSSSASSSHGRQLHQAFQVTNMACSKQVPWLYGRDRPMISVDWLRQGVVQPGFRETSNCSNSFVYVTAALAESTMAMLGYTGSAKRISEAQLMACMPGANCSRAGTVHVLLNQLACNGFAAAASGPNAFPVTEAWKAAEKPQLCDAGDFNPVETGIAGWSFVPPTELAFAQALSRTPIKVSVDATWLQSYRAGFIGCNVRSNVANHAMLAVGFSQRVRATEAPGVSRSGQRNFTFYTGGSYWMLRNSWGNQGSVDGYVYVAKGCGAGNVAPIGLLANRGVMPIFNSSQTYGVGRLQCYFPGEDPDPGCDKNLLLRLSSFCARVDDFLPLKARTNCSCSCIPV